MRVILAVLLLLLGGPAEAAGPLAHREILANGAVLLVAERPAIPIVVVRVGVPAGAVYDPADALGVANLTAALLTRGTARRTGPELDRAIEFVGGSLEAGAGSDGATVTLSVLKKDLGLGLDLLAEVLLRPAFDPDELTRKVTDIQGSLRRSEQAPETVAARQLSRLMFPGHPYGRPVYGTIESVGKITREQVAAFYQRHYRPDGANIVAVGDVTVTEIRRELLQRLAGWTPPSVPVGAVAKAPSVAAAEERTIVRDLTQTTVCSGVRPSAGRSRLLRALGGDLRSGRRPASRLYTRVREERGLAYSVYSSLMPARYGASYLVSLQTRTDGVVEALRLTRQEMARLAREPVAPRELSLAKSYLIGSFPLRLDTSGKLARFLGAVEENGLGLDYPDRYKERIGRVTAPDIQRVAAKYLDPATFSDVQVGR
jgi:zinc protease